MATVIINTAVATEKTILLLHVVARNRKQYLVDIVVLLTYLTVVLVKIGVVKRD